jgi:hypothetical protein
MSRLKKWTTQSGEQIRIKDMDNNHLLNTIAMLERNAQSILESELAACASIGFQGEMAQMDQEHFLSYASADDYLPEIYDDLFEEAVRRNLLKANMEIYA